MTVDSTVVPRAIRASSTMLELPTLHDSGAAGAAPSNQPDLARAGVIWELTGGGRFTDLTPEDLVPDEADWPFFMALWRIDPKLVWIAQWSNCCGEGAPDLAHPVRELRRRVARRGVGRSTFARLAGESNAAALRAFEFLGTSILEGHLRLETLLDQPLPWEGPFAEWFHHFLVRSDADHFDYGRSRIDFTPTQAAYLVRNGLSRFKAGDFRRFIDVEFPLVLRYWRETVRGNRLPGWENLLARAERAHEDAIASEHAKACRWDSGPATHDFGGYRIDALSDSYALWREGLAMRHCIADYAERCIDDGLRVFHLQSQTSRSGWTLALAPDSESEWRVHEIRGPRNRVADADARAVAQAWALAYGGIFPPSENGLAPLQDEDEEEDASEHCPVCSAQYCEEHLVATLELDEGVMGGCLFEAWDDRVKEVQSGLQQALLAGRANPDWPSEIDSLYTALLEDRAKLVVEDDPREPDAEWIIDDDAFADAWCNLDATRLLINYLEEWLNEQPGVIANSYEISTAPGLSWAGTYFHARDPEPVRQRFLKEFCVSPAVERFEKPSRAAGGQGARRAATETYQLDRRGSEHRATRPSGRAAGFSNCSLGATQAVQS